MPIQVFISENAMRLTTYVHIVLRDDQCRVRKACQRGSTGQLEWVDYELGTEAPIAYEFDIFTAQQLYQAMRLHYGDAPDPLLRKDFERERERVDNLTQTLSMIAVNSTTLSDINMSDPEGMSNGTTDA